MISLARIRKEARELVENEGFTSMEKAMDYVAKFYSAQFKKLPDGKAEAKTVKRPPNFVDMPEGLSTTKEGNIRTIIIDESKFPRVVTSTGKGELVQPTPRMFADTGDGQTGITVTVRYPISKPKGKSK